MYCMTENPPEFFTSVQQKKNKNKQFFEVNDFVREILSGLMIAHGADACFHCWIIFIVI